MKKNTIKIHAVLTSKQVQIFDFGARWVLKSKLCEAHFVAKLKSPFSSKIYAKHQRWL